MNIIFLIILILILLILIALSIKKLNNFTPDIIPDVQDRVDYYLSTDLGNIKKSSTIKINELRSNSDINEQVYISPFKDLLIKTNNVNKSFNIAPGDIREPNLNLILCKTRNIVSKNSVILRCMNYKRHWGNYYNRPLDTDFDKKENKVFWRGNTTGQKHNPANRFSLIEKWFNKNINIDVGLSVIAQNKHEYKKYVKGSSSITEFLKYKYLLSIEGNDKDSGINWKLNSNSLVFMAKPNVVSWLMEDTLIPDYHYVLLKDDFSDLEEKLNWCNDNQDKCKQIINNANIYMKQFSDIKKEEQIEIDVINKYFELEKKEY